MLRSIFILFIVILFVSCGAPPEDKFKGLWLNSNKPEIIIEDRHGELFVISDDGGEFIANVEGNILSLTYSSGFGQATLEMKYLDETDHILYQEPGRNSFVELERYYAEDLNNTLGLWVRQGEYAHSTLDIVSENNEFNVQKIDYLGNNSQKDEFNLFLKDGILYKDKESFNNIRFIKVSEDTLTYRNQKYIKSK